MTETRVIAPRDRKVTSKIMATARARDTEPERTLRSALFKRGLRFRLYYGKLPGRPDIVFPRQRVAVFVDGDFWHGSGWRERGFVSKEARFASIRAKQFLDVELPPQRRSQSSRSAPARIRT